MEEKEIIDALRPLSESTPATCEHQCTCDCHQNPNIAHVMACCGACGYGHSRIPSLLLRIHCIVCHGIAPSRH